MRRRTGIPSTRSDATGFPLVSCLFLSPCSPGRGAGAQKACGLDACCEGADDVEDAVGVVEGLVVVGHDALGRLGPPGHARGVAGEQGRCRGRPSPRRFLLFLRQVSVEAPDARAGS
jgi:hypothetical protein